MLDNEQWIFVGHKYYLSNLGRICSKAHNGWYYWIPTRPGHYTSWKRTVRVNNLSTLETSSIRQFVAHHWGPAAAAQITKQHIALIRETSHEQNKTNGTNIPAGRQLREPKTKEYISSGKPLLPPRKCHTCQRVTMNYWCDTCRPVVDPAGNAELSHPDDWHGSDALKSNQDNKELLWITQQTLTTHRWTHS